MQLICYCIQSTDESRTYIGATNNFTRRIKQHNRQISGGAKATQGHQWKPIIHVAGFVDRHQLLRFEWFWKHCIKTTTERGIYRRITMLEHLFMKPEWHHLEIYTNEEIAPFISCSQKINGFLE